MLINGKPKYNDVLSIPEARSGDWFIKHKTVPAGDKLRLTTPRTFILGQRPPVPSVTYNHDTRWHMLHQGEPDDVSPSLWMSDVPIEQWQHDEAFKPMRGHVLVGGLGIGYAVTALARRKNVSRITCVELEADVINLVAPHTNDQGKCNFMNMDLFDFTGARGERPSAAAEVFKFHWAFIDIWAGDGETTFHEYVAPLRKALRAIGIPDHRQRHWNEDVMKMQMYNAIQTRVMCTSLGVPKHDGMPTRDELAEPDSPSVWVQWCAPFFRALQYNRWSDEQALRNAVTYVRYYGTALQDRWIDWT